jgi:hypothetical protein
VQTAAAFAQENSLIFLEVSAKFGENVAQIFQEIGMNHRVFRSVSLVLFVSLFFLLFFLFSFFLLSRLHSTPSELCLPEEGSRFGENVTPLLFFLPFV